MNEAKLKKSHEALCVFAEPHFKKEHSFESFVEETIEQYHGWTPSRRIDLTPFFEQLIEPPEKDLELTKKIYSLLKKCEQILLQLRDKPLIKNATLRDLNSEKYSLKENIEIVIEEYPDEIIAKWPEIEAFGHGVTQPEAILDLKNEITDLYEDLSSSKKKELGKLPKMWLRILKNIIKKNE